MAIHSESAIYGYSLLPPPEGWNTRWHEAEIDGEAVSYLAFQLLHFAVERRRRGLAQPVSADRFAAYGLFSNGGEVARLVQLPNSDPDFTELTSRVSLTLDTQLLQMDRDLALGRLDEGRWELTKLFPDAPAQSRTRVYETDAPITEVVSGGIGTFMLSKTAAPPELVRVRCVEPSSAEVGGTTDVTSTSGTTDEG